MERGHPYAHEREARTVLSVLRTLFGQGCPRSIQLLFALCSSLFDNAVNVFITTFRGEKKWQTYQFVRNQMVRI